MTTPSDCKAARWRRESIFLEAARGSKKKKDDSNGDVVYQFERQSEIKGPGLLCSRTEETGRDGEGGWGVYLRCAEGF